jgi:hypothetical protein
MSNRQAVVIKPSITKEELRIQVEKLVTQDGMTYAESIIDICERSTKA